MEDDEKAQLDAFTTAVSKLRIEYPLLHHLSLEELLQAASVEARNR